MEEDIEYLQRFINRCKKSGSEFYGILKPGHFESLQNLINKYKEQEKIIELAIDELYLFNAYDCDYSDLKEHTCTKNDDDTVEIQKAKCKKCIREIIEKKAKGE